MSNSAQPADPVADELHQLQPVLREKLADRLAVVLDERLLDEYILGEPGLQLGRRVSQAC
jgi:hypothetical protein